MQTAKIRMRCPACGKKLSASPEKEGKLARCPHCGDTIRIVSAPEAPAVAVPPELPQDTESEVVDGVDDAPEARPVEHEEAAVPDALAIPVPAPAPRVSAAAHSEEEETSLHDPDEDLMPVDVPVAAGGGLMRMIIILGFPILLAVGLLGGYVLGGRSNTKPGGDENQPEVVKISHDERQRREDERAYVSSVQIVRFEVGRTDLREHALLGEVRNVGGEILEQVKIVARCLSDGAPIEQELWVVDASASRVGHQAHPLQPGQTRKFVMDLQDMSAAWGGQVQVEVTEVRFHKRPASGAGG